MLMAASLLLCSGAAFLFAADKVTVEATSEDISEGLDLKAVANLFGEVKNLEELEQKLNSEKLHLSNLDLNGDGKVDYLRVVEVSEENQNRHLVLIQAVLAKDIYQDVASIYVESKDKKNVSVQVIGDAYIYGKNYVIEPVYIYRPVIYDWFWGPSWVCYTSPWYWGYWPGWYAPYPCWGYTTYWTHVYVYHYDHPRCVYHYGREPHTQATAMRVYNARSDYAAANASRTFAERTGRSNARELTASRVSTSSTRSYASYSPSSSSSGYRSTSGVSSSSSSSSPRSYSGTTSSTRSYTSYAPSNSSRNYSSSSEYRGSSGSSGSRSYSGTGSNIRSYSGTSSYSGAGSSSRSYSGSSGSRSYSGSSATRR